LPFEVERLPFEVGKRRSAKGGKQGLHTLEKSDVSRHFCDYGGQIASVKPFRASSQGVSIFTLDGNA
jgi:hypothetical protein